MNRLAQIAFVAVWLLLPARMVAEKAVLRPDYIRASLLIADPSASVYSLFGHCALRLQCPSQQMDYCFTFEMSTSAEDLVSFFRGTSMGAFKPAPTRSYIDYYRQEGRGMTEYELNLLPEEKLQLWRAADEEIARGFSRHYGYMHTQCSSMIVYLVGRALRAPIIYGELPDGSFRDQMLEAGLSYPWSAFFWQTIMGPEGDDTWPLTHKLPPQRLCQAWQHATVGREDRHLITAPGRRILESGTGADSCWLSPTMLFSLLLLLVGLVSLAQLLWGWHLLPLAVDIVLTVLHTVVSLLLVWLVLFSRQEGTSWNWYLLAFNPVPLLVWVMVPRWRCYTCYTFVALLVATLVLTPFIPQLDLPHALVIACLIARLVANQLSINNQKKNTI